MVKIDEIVREYLNGYFEPISAIKYVVLDETVLIDEDIDRTPVKNFSEINDTEDLSQLKALAMLYYTSEYRAMIGKSPYLKIDTDGKGITYATITKNYLTLASRGGFSKRLKKTKTSSIPSKLKISLDEVKGEALSIADTNSFEDTIDDKFTRDMYDSVDGYAGVKEIPSKGQTSVKEYSMMFVPVNNSLVGKEIIHIGKGVLVENYTYIPVIKNIEFKVGSN